MHLLLYSWWQPSSLVHKFKKFLIQNIKKFSEEKIILWFFFPLIKEAFLEMCFLFSKLTFSYWFLVSFHCGQRKHSIWNPTQHTHTRFTLSSIRKRGLVTDLLYSFHNWTRWRLACRFIWTRFTSGFISSEKYLWYVCLDSPPVEDLCCSHEEPEKDFVLHFSSRPPTPSAASDPSRTFWR